MKTWFFCFRSETALLATFGPENKIASLSWNLVPRIIRISIIQWCCSFFFFSFRPEYHLEQIWSKNQNCQFSQKFVGRWGNSLQLPQKWFVLLAFWLFWPKTVCNFHTIFDFFAKILLPYKLNPNGITWVSRLV